MDVSLKFTQSINMILNQTVNYTLNTHSVCITIELRQTKDIIHKLILDETKTISHVDIDVCRQYSDLF
jgi:hypothetical protein